MARPQAHDAAVYFHNYINYVIGDSVQEVIQNHSKELLEFYMNLPEAKADYAYAEGKWTIKEVLQHTTDSERVFSYRALRFARKDATPLPSFDQNLYAANSHAASRTLQWLKEEFAAVRKSTELLLQSFSEEQLAQTGTAGNNSITVNAIAFIIYGHLLHHKKILEDNYLV